MVQAFKITGKTYPHRKVLRSHGCLFDRDEMAYIIAADRASGALAYVEQNEDLSSEPYDATEEQVTPATGERLREIRQDRQDRRAERLRSRADAAERRAEKHSKRISKGERDFLSLCEPVKIGHHSERRHRKLLERARNAMDNEMSERVLADKLRQKADWVAPARVKGDAERQRQASRDANAHIEVGDTVRNAMWGVGVVTKINKLSFTVWYAERKFHQKVDKSWCTLVEKGTGEANIQPKFKKGDQVYVTRLVNKYPGIIVRRTSTGYSVDYQFLGRTERGTFNEYSITPREEVTHNV